MEHELGEDFMEFKKDLEKRIINQAHVVFEDTQYVESLKQETRKFCQENNDFLEHIYKSAKKYDELLDRLNLVKEYDESRNAELSTGIIALNGTSGVGQSFVMKYIQKELEKNQIPFERIYLLGTREQRDNEGHKDPYIFVDKTRNGYECIHTGKEYSDSDIYFEYESRPGANNAIVKDDILKADSRLLYLETVIPTLIKMKNEPLSGFSPLDDKLKVAYLAADSGTEWVKRLVAREPHKLSDKKFLDKLVGRVDSSLADMEIAAKEQIPTAVHVLDHGEETAKKVLTAWNMN